MIARMTADLIMWAFGAPKTKSKKTEHKAPTKLKKRETPSELTLP